VYHGKNSHLAIEQFQQGGTNTIYGLVWIGAISVKTRTAWMTHGRRSTKLLSQIVVGLAMGRLHTKVGIQLLERLYCTMPSGCQET
jgi:hypothetical protein